MTSMSLEDIALRLDELSVEHPDVPDLQSLQEAITEHFDVVERLSERIRSLDNENQRLRYDGDRRTPDSRMSYREFEERSRLEQRRYMSTPVIRDPNAKLSINPLTDI